MQYLKRTISTAHSVQLLCATATCNKVIFFKLRIILYIFVCLCLLITATCPLLREKCPYSEFLVFSQYSAQMWKNTDQKNSEYWHFSRSPFLSFILFLDKIAFMFYSSLLLDYAWYRKTLVCWRCKIELTFSRPLKEKLYSDTIIQPGTPVVTALTYGLA